MHIVQKGTRMHIDQCSRDAQLSLMVKCGLRRVFARSRCASFTSRKLLSSVETFMMGSSASGRQTLLRMPLASAPAAVDNTNTRHPHEISNKAASSAAAVGAELERSASRPFSSTMSDISPAISKKWKKALSAERKRSESSACAHGAMCAEAILAITTSLGKSDSTVRASGDLGGDTVGRPSPCGSAREWMEPTVFCSRTRARSASSCPTSRKLCRLVVKLRTGTLAAAREAVSTDKVPDTSDPFLSEPSWMYRQRHEEEAEELSARPSSSAAIRGEKSASSIRMKSCSPSRVTEKSIVRSP
mmetsp:Transcript_51852/g.119232  ORF Transcript_51852/g.119232 Transcript_51852/m.119232 type:complete len:302 (+) Transcript_51852:140-1045(+)